MHVMNSTCIMIYPPGQDGAMLGTRTCVVRQAADAAGVQLQVVRVAVPLRQLEQLPELAHGPVLRAQQRLQLGQLADARGRDDAGRGLRREAQSRQLLLYLIRHCRDGRYQTWIQERGGQLACLVCPAIRILCYHEKSNAAPHNAQLHRRSPLTTMTWHY